ncbi:unnamed protein product [Orchesella dallaii]|uniref:DUF4806 domain-containing protein n=1 Tax=Orchesella dallaii TaxID=48710 RepID=A0ABP1Q5Q0_9HEXA
MSFYAVVEFTEENGATAVVSSNWLRNDEKYCCWPGGNLNKLAEAHAKVDWNSYQKARHGCQKSEYTSNLETSANEATPQSKKLRRKRPIVIPDISPLKKARTASRSGEISTQSRFGTPKLQLVNAHVIQSPSYLNKTPCSSRTSAGSFRNHQTQPTPLALNFGLDQATAPTIHPNFPSATNYTSLQTTSAQATNDGDHTVINDVTVNTNTTPAVAETRDSLGYARFEKTVLEYLVKVLDNQRELLRRTADPTKAKSPTNLPVTIPLDSIDSFNDFNQWLASPTHHRNTCAELSVIGGQSIPSITQRLLVALLTNRIAKELSLTGKGNKTQAGIKGTPLHKLIYDTVRLTKGGETATNSEIDSAIQKWLKGAPDRDGGRKRRRTEICSNDNEGTPTGLGDVGE